MQGRHLWILLVLLGLFLFSVTAPDLAWGQSGIILSTAYPGISLEPGQRNTFPLKVRNEGLPPQKIDLAVVSAPEGWQPTFKGNASVIHQVFVHTDKEEEVDFSIEVPPDTKPGTYNLTLKAQGRDASSFLQLSVRVGKIQAGQDKMISQFPVLSGTSTTSFQFRVELVNNSTEEKSYSLGAKASPGWQVTFSPAYESKQIASLSLKPNQTQSLDVTVKPPQGIKEGKYDLPVEAVSGSSKVGVNLQVIITGTYELQVSTPSGRLNAQAFAGRESPLTLIIKNTGSADLHRINFSADKPENWSVTFHPDQLDALAVGETRQVTAFIKADHRALAGDYVIAINAEASETKGRAEFRVAVKTPTLWGFVGVLIILIVIGGVGWTFYKYGRR